MNKLLFFVLMAFQMNAQDTIVFPKIDLYKRNILDVSYGIPLGNLSDKYQSSINTAFYMRTKVAKRQFIDFGAELSGIISGKKVAYRFNNEILNLEGSKTSFLLGFRYSRFIVQSKNENFHIETNSGLGWKYLHYTKPEGDSYKGLKPTLNTFAVTQGLKIIYHGFGVHCSYHYSPYDLFNSKVENNFGSSSVNFGISGSWNF